MSNPVPGVIDAIGVKDGVDVGKGIGVLVGLDVSAGDKTAVGNDVFANGACVGPGLAEHPTMAIKSKRIMKSFSFTQTPSFLIDCSCSDFTSNCCSAITQNKNSAGPSQRCSRYSILVQKLLRNVAAVLGDLP